MSYLSRFVKNEMRVDFVIFRGGVGYCYCCSRQTCISIDWLLVLVLVLILVILVFIWFAWMMLLLKRERERERERKRSSSSTTRSEYRIITKNETQEYFTLRYQSTCSLE